MEIEEAILNLSDNEMKKLSTWWESFKEREVDAKKRALKETAGYLTEADDDFVKAVEEAGKNLPDSHAW